MKLSIVVPVYGSPTRLPDLVTRVLNSINTLDSVEAEIILVNDACPKNSWDIIKSLTELHAGIIGINFSRNFGQHYAITAGLAKSSGDWVVVMDCDLQDVPEEIPNLYKKAQEGYDIVFAARENRKDSSFKKLGSSSFYKVLSYATDTKQTGKVANFGIYRRKVVDALLMFKEQLRFLPVNVRWLGFKTNELSVRHDARDEGKSTYSFRKLLSLATDVIFSFSNKPMGLLIRVGLLISLTSIIVAASFIFRYFLNDITVQGWTGIMVSLWFMFGAILFSLGVIGIYVSKAFDESKGRPLYIIDEMIESPHQNNHHS